MRRLLHLIRGGPPNLPAALLTLKSRAEDRIFGYDPSNLCLTQPPKVPWTIQWLLTSHSPKHRFLSNARPPLEWLVQDVRMGLNKFLGKCHARNPGAQPSSVKFAVATQSTAPNAMIGSLEHRWSQHFLRVVCDTARGYRSHSTSGNLCGLHRLALKQLKASGLVYLQLDKHLAML